MKEKSNRVYKLAAVLMILCLITACVIGTTLAKYTTSGSGSDTAQVAKWGVKVAISGTLFGKAYGYNTASTGANSIVAESESAISVKGGNEVVAPGTKNEAGLKVDVKGTPEVSYTITTTSDGSKDICLNAGTYAVMQEVYGVNAATDVTNYYTFSEGTYTKATSYVAGTTYYKATDVAEVTADYHPITWMVDSVEKSFTDAIGELSLNTSVPKAPNTEINHSKVLTWEWKETNSQTYADAADTILGNLQAGVSVVKLSGTNYINIETADYSLEVNVSLTITVTQVD